MVMAGVRSDNLLALDSSEAFFAVAIANDGSIDKLY